MKSQNKKIIAISISTIILITLFIWYFLWVIAGKWFIYKNAEFQQQLNVRPSIIDKLPASPPDKWVNISIDSLSLSLPMYRFHKIKATSSSTGIGFLSDEGAIFLPSIVPTVELLKTLKENKMKYPLMSYEDFLAEFSAIPDDISFFKSRSENKNIFKNLTLKLIAMPVPGLVDVLAVDSSNVKAICIISKTHKNKFYATTILFNQIENMTFDITFPGYKDQDILKSDVLNILGSIKLPDYPLDAEQVKDDIESISTNYKLTKQTL